MCTSVIVYGNETWPAKKEGVIRLEELGKDG